MSQPQGTTLLRLERGRILDGVFLPSPESQTKECKVKPWVKMLAQNRSTRGKNKKSKKVGQSKATKSSQGRAQSRWRRLQA